MRIILSVFFTLLFINCLAEACTISGKSSVKPGATETYTAVWQFWDNTYENYANVTWNVTGGSVISSNKHVIVIQWNTLEGYLDGSGFINVAEDLGSAQASLNVTIVNNTQGTSELCNGFLGPPVIAIDFGSGNNPGPPLPNGTTTYTYNASCAITPGQYTVVNNSISCRDLWWNIPHDHTGNPNGYFLMVDGNSSRGEFYRTTVSGLTSAFRYQFSAWCGNLINQAGYGADPNIRFEIYDLGGRILASSGTIVVPITIPFRWQQISAMVNIPAGVTAVQVVIVDVQDAAFGNDMVLDDISFAPCYPPIIASFSSTAAVDRAHSCNNGTVDLYSSWPSTTPFQNPSYQWQRSSDNGITWNNIPGATSIHFIQTENTPGIYQYKMYCFETSNPSAFVISNILTYYVQTMIVDAKTTDFYVCSGGTVSGQIPSSSHLQFADPVDALTFTYSWSPGTYLTNPNVTPTYFSISVAPPPDNGPPQPVINYTYTLTVTNTNYGCTSSNTQTVAIHYPRKVFVPNAFTPGGPNNLFRPVNIEDYPGSKFWVFNRLGERVFYSEGPTLQDYSWDGNFNGIPQGAGTFVWQVSMIGCPSRIFSSSDGEGVPHGTVILIR